MVQKEEGIVKGFSDEFKLAKSWNKPLKINDKSEALIDQDMRRDILTVLEFLDYLGSISTLAQNNDVDFCQMLYYVMDPNNPNTVGALFEIMHLERLNILLTRQYNSNHFNREPVKILHVNSDGKKISSWNWAKIIVIGMVQFAFLYCFYHIWR